MYPMPINGARQLVAEKRASYEAIAFRRQFRRFVSRQVAQDAPNGTLVARRTPMTVATRGAAAEVPAVCKVA